jgi:hypothetical protein
MMANQEMNDDYIKQQQKQQLLKKLNASTNAGADKERAMEPKAKNSDRSSQDEEKKENVSQHHNQSQTDKKHSQPNHQSPPSHNTPPEHKAPETPPMGATHTKQSSFSKKSQEHEQLEHDKYQQYDKGYSKLAFAGRSTKPVNSLNSDAEDLSCWTEMGMIDRMFPHLPHKFDNDEYRVNGGKSRVKPDANTELGKCKTREINNFFNVDSQFSFGYNLVSKTDTAAPTTPYTTDRVSDESQAYHDFSKEFKYIKLKKQNL